MSGTRLLAFLQLLILSMMSSVMAGCFAGDQTATQRVATASRMVESGYNAAAIYLETQEVSEDRKDDIVNAALALELVMEQATQFAIEADLTGEDEAVDRVDNALLKISRLLAALGRYTQDAEVEATANSRDGPRPSEPSSEGD